MKHLFYLTVVALSISACKKDKDSETTTGTINGNVAQYDQSGATPGARSGVKVTLDNDDVTATTDDAGNYTLSKVKPGIYTIYFSKPGCGVYQVNQINFPGNGILTRDAEVVESPTFNFNSATVSFPDSLNPTNRPSATVLLNLKLNPVNRVTHAAVIFSEKADLDIYASSYTAYMASVFTIPANTTDFSGTANVAISNHSKPLYAKIYTYSGKTSVFNDASTGKTMIYGFGSSLPVTDVK